MKKIGILLFFFFETLGISDTLHNTTKVTMISTAGLTARDTLSKMIKNEVAAKQVFPKEAEDLGNIRSLNRPIGKSILQTRTFDQKISASTSLDGKLSSKRADVNFLISEDTSVIANTDKTTY